MDFDEKKKKKKTHTLERMDAIVENIKLKKNVCLYPISFELPLIKSCLV